MSISKITGIQKDVDILIQDAQFLVNDVADLGTEQIERFKTEITNSLNKALEACQLKEISQAGSCVIDKTKLYVHEKPLISLTAAAALGGILGAFIGRRMK
jgi:ElaB/YqjD/DUF883 family membrane-anchored ribosome-binding protein